MWFICYRNTFCDFKLKQRNPTVSGSETVNKNTEQLTWSSKKRWFFFQVTKQLYLDTLLIEKNWVFLTIFRYMYM